MPEGRPATGWPRAPGTANRGGPGRDSHEEQHVRIRTLLLALAACTAAASVRAAPPEGYLCCNMRTDGSWISDSNYAEDGKRIIPFGTPVQATGYGRYRVKVLIDGQRQEIGNDYSRDLDNEAFAHRYIVPEDPRARAAAFPAKIRQAIEGARVTRGMTREQVLMALGYPMSSENPDLNADIWRFWLSSFDEFQVLFDAGGKVRDVVASPTTRTRIWVD